jgi:hypothetical protein
MFSPSILTAPGDLPAYLGQRGIYHNYYVYIKQSYLNLIIAAREFLPNLNHWSLSAANLIDYEIKICFETENLKVYQFNVANYAFIGRLLRGTRKNCG